jgi:hypothetical protein
MLIRNRSHKLAISLLAILIWTCGLFAQTAPQQYQRQDSARFRVFYMPDDAKVVRGLWETLHDHVPDVENRLGLALADTVAFVVTPTPQEWGRLAQGTPLWANGVAFAERGYAVLKSPRFGLAYGPLPVTAIHEYIHLLLHAGAPRAEIPRWLDEGLAQVLAGQMDYVDTEVLARAAAANRLHTLWQLEGLMGMSAPEARQGYAESAAAVQLLQKRYGLSGVTNLVHELRKGKRIDDVFPSTFGMPFSAFERGYEDYVKTNYRLTFLGDTQLWVSGAFIVLVFAAGFVMWWRRKKTLAKWQAEESRGPVEMGDVPPPPYVVNYTIIRNRLEDERTDESGDDRPPYDRPQAGN